MHFKIKNIFVSLAGNALEWFDFTIYAFFVKDMATIFFPTKDRVLSLILAYGAFATGFLIRPIGGAIIGYMGDHLGRKRAMIFTALLMSISTILVAFLPSYSVIGVTAPVLLIIMRLLQSFSISGELNTSANFLIEYLSQSRRGFSGSLVMATAFIGILLSALVATSIIALLSPEQTTNFGWRIAFFITGLFGFVISIMRFKMDESPFFEKKHKKHDHIWSTLLKNYKSVILSLFLPCIMAVSNWYLIGYFHVFLQGQGFSAKFAMMVNSVAMFILICLMVTFGKLSDRIGRKILLVFGACSFIVFSYPIFWLLSQHNIVSVFIAEILFVVILAPIVGLVPTVLAEIFPTEVRNTGTNVGYNLCLAIFGGTSPMVALSLVKLTHSTISPAWYLMGCAVITLISILFVREKKFLN